MYIGFVGRSVESDVHLRNSVRSDIIDWYKSLKSSLLPRKREVMTTASMPGWGIGSMERLSSRRKKRCR